jgi:hypothetical protein
MPIASSVFPALSYTRFKVSGLILRSLMQFELILVQGDSMDLVSVFCMEILVFPATFVEKTVYSHCMFLVPLSKIRWAKLCGFISRSSILFHWSLCLFLCQYHAIFIAIAL